MKTAVTVIDTVQVSMDEYKDIKTTKVFDDESTIKEIKEWVIFQNKLKVGVDEIRLSAIGISDVL